MSHPTIYQVGKLRPRYSGDGKLVCTWPLMKMTHPMMSSSSHDGTPLGRCSDIRTVSMGMAMSPVTSRGPSGSCPLISRNSHVLGSGNLRLNGTAEGQCMSSAWKPGTTQREPGSWVEVYKGELKLVLLGCKLLTSLPQL